MPLDVNEILAKQKQIKGEGETPFDWVAWDKIREKTAINLDEQLTAPPVALSIGSHDWGGQMYDNPTFTYGEISVIIALQKTMKTFFKSALVASYIGGQATNHFPNFKTHRENDKYILDIDTEQGIYYAQRAFRAVQRLTGLPYPNYLPHGTRGLSDLERVQLIDGYVNSPKYEGRIGWISIDGIADLLFNTNDQDRSREVSDKLLSWADKGIHINCIIHKTFDKDKATGHLGSFAQKRCETSITLSRPDKDKDIIEAKQVDARGARFDPFQFHLNTKLMIPEVYDGDANDWL